MKVLLFANTDWYLYNFRKSLALALRQQGIDVLLVSPPGSYGARLEKIGLRWIAAPMLRHSLNPVRELALVNWLRRLVLDERIDLVHGFTIKCAVYGSIAARLAGDRPRVSAVAGMGYVFTSADMKARVLRPLVSSLLRIALAGSNARLILQNGDDALMFQNERLVAPEQVRLIPGSGVDCRRFTPGERARGDGAFRVLLSARLLLDKGVLEFVDAARLVRARGRDISFLLAGAPDSGNPAAVPERLVRQWHTDGIVEWLGHVEDMVQLFQNVDAVVLPSYREGLPKGLVEAAACGLPLVATDVPGCRDVVSHEVDGLLIPVRNASALANAICRLERDAALCTRLGTAARAKALAVFDEVSIIERTISVYTELMQRD